MSDFYEPWLPVLGDRVRVCLSGECRVEVTYLVDSDLYSDDDDVSVAGHLPEEHGVVGTVKMIDVYGETGSFGPNDGHWYYVEYDEFLAVSVTTNSQSGQYFAAAELMRLEGE